ncbi:MAG: hypothetical protein WBR18_08475 [Anaerolineales bacterium]
MPRIVVVGTSCAGKTTFAEQVAARCSIPHVELDDLYWFPDWEPRPLEVFRNAVRAAAAEQDWVIDGNYSKARDLIWPRATDIVWLNLPFRTVFWRALQDWTAGAISGRTVRWKSRDALACAV